MYWEAGKESKGKGEDKRLSSVEQWESARGPNHEKLETGVKREFGLWIVGLVYQSLVGGELLLRTDQGRWREEN